MPTIKFNRNHIDIREPVSPRIRKGLWWLRLITLIFVDYTFLFLAWILSEYRHEFNQFNWNIYIIKFLPITIVVSIQIIALLIQGNYHSGKKRYNYFDIIKTLTFAHGLILIFYLFYNPLIELTRSTLILSWLLSICFVCIGRLIVNITLDYLRVKKVFGRTPVFVICDVEDYEKVIELIKQEKHYIIRGYADAKALDRIYRQETLEKLNQLSITEVFVSWNAIKNRMFLCWLFQSLGISVHLLPIELKPIYRDIGFTKIGGINCLSWDCPVIIGKDFWIKRVLDFSVAALFVILTFPIYIGIGIAIKLDSPGSVFYKQTRIGLHGKQFQVWKFRTMKSNADKLQKELEALNETKDGIIFKIKHDPRITRVGKFLRRYSLDELPQFFNVLLGEMSLVGPRPLPTRDVNKFSQHHFIRQEVLPGITGLWQVSGRSDILDFEQVIKLDLNYIENWSLWLDFEIILKTIKVVFKKEGAY